MELLGGLLVLLVMAWCGATICAGGLCSEKKAPKEPGDTTMRLFPITVSMAAGMFMMAVSAFAQTIEHPALLPFNVAGAQREVVTGHATTRARVALVASQIDKNVWRHPLYPFAVAGEPVGGTRVTKSAKTAAVKRSSSSEPAVWHPALVPFSIGGR